MKKMSIIDFHSHAFPSEIAEKAVNNLENHYKIKIENGGQTVNLLSSLKAANVEKAVLLAAATTEKQVTTTNDWLIQKKSEKLIPFGTIHPDFSDFKQELDRLKDNGIKGIKFHSDFQQFHIDDPKMWPIYDCIGEDFVILFHVGDETLNYSSPAKLAKIIEAFPNMRVVAAHLGGYMQWGEVKECLIGKNLFFDTSSSFWRLEEREILEIIRAHGCDKILFGTDYPIKTHREELSNIINLPIKDEEKKLILGINADNLLGANI